MNGLLIIMSYSLRSRVSLSNTSGGLETSSIGLNVKQDLKRHSSSLSLSLIRNGLQSK